ncbi:MAG: hypothetical protein KAI72_05355 [Candidatus Pacebacteria bacterium]|nr:hypothetical protein [Candidatus Paceibacterota bacterium]
MSENKKLISDPQVRINNETFQVVPNSIKGTLGLGESIVKAQSAGGGNVQVVYSENVESKLGKVTLSVFVTQDKIESVKSLKGNMNTNYISITSSGFALTMRQATLINDPEINFSNEGEIELEFQGLPIE